MANARRVQFSVGLLVLAGAALLVGFVLFLTRDRVTDRDARFETYFRESVQGLEVGSSVRYRGVAIGRVTEIALVSAAYGEQMTDVPAEAFQLVVVRFAINLARLGTLPPTEVAIAQGLRARLASQGITGVLYIELDFVDPERIVIPTVPWIPQATWIPAAPSTLAQAQGTLEVVMRQLQDANIGEILINMNGLLADLRGVVQGTDAAGPLAEASGLLRDAREVLAAADIPALARDLRATTQATRGVVEGEEFREVLAALARAANDLRATAQRLPPTIAQIEATLRAARATTTDLQAELAPVLRDLRSTTANLRDTTEALRRSPSQALFGAPPPPGPGR